MTEVLEEMMILCMCIVHCALCMCMCKCMCISGAFAGLIIEIDVEMKSRCWHWHLALSIWHLWAIWDFEPFGIEAFERLTFWAWAFGNGPFWAFGNEPFWAFGLHLKGMYVAFDCGRTREMPPETKLTHQWASQEQRARWWSTAQRQTRLQRWPPVAATVTVTVPHRLLQGWTN